MADDDCRCWNEGQYGRVHREDCPIHGPQAHKPPPYTPGSENIGVPRSGGRGMGLVHPEVVERLEAEVERLKEEGTPGVMHAVDRAFYELTVSQRDAAWREVEQMKSEARVLAQHETAKLRERLSAVARESSEQRQRADKAESDLTFLTERAIPKLEEERDAALEILRDLTDPDPCQYDHHDLCQAHHLHPRPCPHERAKELLR